ncbi:terpenoid synthase [Ramaria rubella]|nr:terpenoid synthase [Ramaria rubella]
MTPSTQSVVKYYQLPDLISICPFPSAYHKNGDAIAAASEQWIERTCRVFTEDMRRHLDSLMGGQLAAYCYTQCNDERFRLVCDFMLVLFLLDDLSDDLMTRDTEVLADVIMNALAFPESYRPTHMNGKEQPEVELDASLLTRDYWARLSPGAGPQVQARFINNLELYLIAVHQQARDRASNNIPTLEKYVSHRRTSSGCKPLFDILEYSLDMQLPDYIIEDPRMAKMKDCVNDFVAFSNDIFSYDVEQSRGDTHNIVTVIMHNYKLDLQRSVDYAGDMCREALNEYCTLKADFPAYSPEINAQLFEYFRGLESWISGSLQWSYLTPRYFGNKGSEIKKHRMVKLSSKGPLSANAA